jgi:F-type H+-transporting ATPase subunit epsilon
MVHGAAAGSGTQAETLDVRVVTPEGTLYRGEASFVAAPASDGEVGVLPSHTPLISRLGTGVLRVNPKDGSAPVKFAVRGGFLQVVKNHVTLLATEAATREQTDFSALQAQLEETLKQLASPPSDEEYAALLDLRRWIEARQKLA